MTEQIDAIATPWVSPPGDTISDVLEERGWTQVDLAERTGYTTKHVSLLINGKAPITQDTAIKLERVLGSTARFWLSREAQYRASLARIAEVEGLESEKEWLAELPLKDMIRFGWIKSYARAGEQVAECLRFFSVANVQTWRETYASPDRLGVAWRASAAHAKDNGAVAAWLREGERQAANIAATPYSKEAFISLLQDLRSLTNDSNPQSFVPKLVESCRKVGVAVVFVPAPKGCPACGVTRWLSSDKALLMLSLRYRSNDSLWFTFFHEAAHLLLHGKKLMFLELIDNVGCDSADEREANEFSSNHLIPKAHLHRLPSLQTKDAVIYFAQQIGIHPGVVVGRLQHEKYIPRSWMNDLKVRYTWSYES